ncbi:MAG: glycosyltransferase [Defluviitaleaceae bacterium]|nr:glycosyltransferase [Defluviitaleaceae bacterium]
MKRILVILPNLDLGGMETVVMNYFRNLDRSKIVFDFVVHGEPGFFEEEARALGARIFRVPTRSQGFFENISAMRRIYAAGSIASEDAYFSTRVVADGRSRVSEEKYDIVIVCTEHAFAFIELFVAWTSGVKTRAAWSHFSDYQGASRLKRRAHFFARPLMCFYANLCLACTKDAGVWLFGKKFAKNLQNPAFHIINNAIDLEIFSRQACGGTREHNERSERFPRHRGRVSEATRALEGCGREASPLAGDGFEPREKIRAAHGLTNDEIAVGIAGRLTAVKNHAFALEIFKELLASGAGKNAALFIIGDGELREEIETQSRNLGITNRVIFTGALGNIHEYYQALDVLILPSHHEGLPVVAIEAQASGLPVILSDKLTRDVQISDLAHYESLNAGATAWAEKILALASRERTERTTPDLSESGFDITREAAKLQKILLEL